MKEILDNLSTCLYSGEIWHSNRHIPKFTFTEWLLKSNCPKIGPYLKEDIKLLHLPPQTVDNMIQYVVYSSLEEIFDVLIKYPQADYFWYSHKGELTWTEPHLDEVPNGALRVDKEKMKVFLRDIKIKKLLQ